MSDGTSSLVPSDTIYAAATAPGRSGVAVIRISGPNAHPAAKTLVGELPGPGRFGLRAIRSTSGERIDEAVVLTFVGPHSFTGEDIVEFQIHGSIAVQKKVLDLLAATGFARIANPGEFTQRALENDRLTLPQVEGLAALIDAETEAQRLIAQRTINGALKDRTSVWRRNLIQALALLDAIVDFADDDVPDDVSRQVTSLFNDVIDDLEKEMVGALHATELRNGFEVAIVGRPNAGKSTLINAIARRSVALTSDISGTTRDVLEMRIDLGGLPVVFLDTAGVHEGGDTLEKLGIERTLDRAKSADLRVFLRSDTDEASPVALAKTDLLRTAKDDVGDFADGVSGATGQGIPELLDSIKTELSRRVHDIGAATHQRHIQAMERAKSALTEATSAANTPNQEELVAAHVRTAISNLDSLIGRIDVEDVLDEIFSSFCLGK